MLAKAAFPSFFFTLAGFILLLLVTLSVPIIKTIYLLHITGSYSSSIGSATTAANAGVFGMCYKGSSASFVGITYSDNAACTHPKVGYTFYDRFLGLDDRDSTKAIVKGLAGALLLNPIAAGLAGISLITSFFAWFCASRAWEIITFLTLLLSSFAAWIAFWLDLAIVLVARARIKKYTDGLVVGHFGNAVWIGLAGAVCLSVAICLAGCGSFGRYRSDYRSRTVANVPPPVEKPGYGRRRFWQRKTTTARGTY
ncbi:hypothetical protein IAT38_000936 [Cryptococcus sp. DSM 104549]